MVLSSCSLCREHLLFRSGTLLEVGGSAPMRAGYCICFFCGLAPQRPHSELVRALRPGAPAATCSSILCRGPAWPRPGSSARFVGRSLSPLGWVAAPTSRGAATPCPRAQWPRRRSGVAAACGPHRLLRAHQPILGSGRLFLGSGHFQAPGRNCGLCLRPPQRTDSRFDTSPYGFREFFCLGFLEWLSRFDLHFPLRSPYDKRHKYEGLLMAFKNTHTHIHR